MLQVGQSWTVKSRTGQIVTGYVRHMCVTYVTLVHVRKI